MAGSPACVAFSCVNYVHTYNVLDTSLFIRQTFMRWATPNDELDYTQESEPLLVNTDRMHITINERKRYKLQKIAEHCCRFMGLILCRLHVCSRGRRYTD